jgi:hypothetical protein
LPSSHYPATPDKSRRRPLYLAGVALLIGVLAGALYWGPAFYFGHSTTPDVAYFNHLAAAFLQGRLYLANPPSTHDLTFAAGHWYVPFPPLPALLMLPWIARFGLAALNTTLFCALFGALNAAFSFLLLQALAQRRQINLSLSGAFWLTALFGIGSVHWYMATIGSVWFVAQICTVTFVLLAAWAAAATGSPWLTGTALALAMLGRPTVLFTWPLLFGIAAAQWTPSLFPLRALPWRRALRWSLASALPMAGAVVALLVYNWARFGDPFDFGYLTENVASELAPNLRTYGQFNLHYLPKNFWAMWLAGPRWLAEENRWAPDPEGMSLLLTTPAIIYLARARGRSPIVWGGWLALILLMVPLLLYYNTGWWQFGYRFSLDFMTPLLVLLAVAADRQPTWAMRLLIVLGILVNGYGLLWWHS